MQPAQLRQPHEELEATRAISREALGSRASGEERESNRKLVSPKRLHDIELRRGATIGRFVLLEGLGQGAMGFVYKAYDSALRREVALKFLRSERGDGMTTSDESLALVAEAQAMAKLSHPNVVAIYDVLVEREHVVLAMEYIRGQTLRAWIEEARASTASTRRIVDAFVQAARGLMAAHRAGLVHRDFKPTNVLISDDGRVLVTDFGIAEHEGAWRTASADPSALVIGTPRYMAPEQHCGKPVDARADQYAFCVALWEALCGAAPFAGSAPDTLASAKLAGPPPWPAHAPIGRRIVAAIGRGLAPRPEDRWPHMQALLDALSPSRTVGRTAWAAAALVLPVLGAWSWVRQAEQAQRCSGAEELLRGTWNVAVRSEVQAALVATGVAYAPQTAQRVQATLDGYARGWAEQHRSACEATSRGEQDASAMDLRMGCLHDRKIALESAVGVLRQADARVVEKAVQLTSGLPLLRRCADLEALQAEVPPPEDPEDAARVERTRALLAAAKAEQQAARYDLALEKVTAAEAVASELDRDPHPCGIECARVRAELLLARGMLAFLQGRFEGLEKPLEQAMSLALAAGATETATLSLGLLGRLLGERQARFAEGITLTQRAVELSQTVRDGGAFEGDARSDLGLVLWAAGRHAQAHEQLQRSLTLREQAYGSEHYRVAEARSNVAVSLNVQGRHVAAEALFRQAIEVLERTLGPLHPVTAGCRNNLAMALQNQARYPEAEAEFRHALELREAALGPEHPRVGESHNNIGVVLGLRGRHEEAETEHRMALRLQEKALGPEHPRVLHVRENIATALVGQGRLEEAESELREVLAVQERVLGSDHPKHAVGWQNLGSLLARRGQLHEAERELARALAHFTKHFGAEHPDTASSRHHLAMVLADQGRAHEARRELQRALAAFETALGTEHPSTKAVRDAIASVAETASSDLRERPVPPPRDGAVVHRAR